MMELHLTVNGSQVTKYVDEMDTLLDVLREEIHLTG